MKERKGKARKREEARPGKDKAVYATRSKVKGQKRAKQRVK